MGPIGQYRFALSRAGTFLFALASLALNAGVIVPPANATTPEPAPSLISDGTGESMRVTTPVTRIISLSPAHTDMLRSMGVGSQIVGTIGDQPSDSTISVGNVTGLDYEKIIALQPDLVVAWEGGTPTDWITRLRTLGLPVYVARTRNLNDIPETVAALGQLFDTRTAQQAAGQARAASERLAHLRQTFANRSDQPPLRVFYQVWQQPLMTINRHHIISDAIVLCGGTNVFGTQRALVPQITREAVIAANPGLIVSAISGLQPDREPDLAAAGLSHWLTLRQIDAVRERQFLILDGDQMTRPTFPMLEAVEQLCQRIASVRTK